MIDDEGHFLFPPRRRDLRADSRPGDVIQSADVLGAHCFRVRRIEREVVHDWICEEDTALSCSLQE